MNEYLRNAVLKGEITLFLGAGASKGCKTSRGEQILDGVELAKELAKQACLSYADEALDDVYAAARAQLATRLDPILENLFRNTQPSNEYQILAQYAWRRIYTLNIDDGLDQALKKQRTQDIYTRLCTDPFEERDQFFQRLDYIKLNGSVDRLASGIIFSSSEYARATATSLPWYEQCSSDFLRTPFLFIGTKLNEPLLKFHIERYKRLNDKNPGKSYVITPSATEIQKSSLLQYNVVHIEGTLSDFTNWLQIEFPEKIRPLDLAKENVPAYAAILSSDNPSINVKLLNGVSAIKRDMPIHSSENDESGSIRSFYKGFQATWGDIVNGIPADLDVLKNSIALVKNHSGKEKIIPFIGPAGSGKSTLLMQLCYELCRDSDVDVFYINEPLPYLSKTLEFLTSQRTTYRKIYVAIDNVDFSVDQLAEAHNSGKIANTIILCATRANIWAKRVNPKLGHFSHTPITVSEFSENDASEILAKLQEFGSWTTLGQLSKNDQLKALVTGAKKQLLIALLEATYGRGFEKIIESDYATLTTEDEKIFLLIVGVITERRFDAPVSLVDRALDLMGILSKSTVLSNDLAGIVIQRHDRLTVRHPVYVRHLLEHVVDPKLTAKAIGGVLQSFSHYASPIMKHADKRETTIYKGIINHKFLWEVLKGRKTLIIPLYKSLEKHFELDGLFWLQYGLALRDFHNNLDALDKLRTAFSAYKMDHTQHALGQQLLIVANESTDKRTGIGYANEARECLEPLDEIIDSDDTYPIVTLAEGHTKIARKFDGDEVGREVAKSYIDTLKRRCDKQPENSRLRNCYEIMFKYVATGVWHGSNDMPD